MKPSAVVLALRPMRVGFSPQRRGATPWHLRISVWQTDSWRQKVISLREGPNPRERARTLLQRVNQLRSTGCTSLT